MSDSVCGFICGVNMAVSLACIFHIAALGADLLMSAVAVVGVLEGTFVSAHEVCAVSSDDNFIVVFAAFLKCQCLVHLDFPNTSVA